MDNSYVCWAMILLTLFNVLQVSRGESCDAALFCQEKDTVHLVCDSCIPHVLPNHISEVTVANNSVPFDNASFSDTSWRSIQRLDVSGSATKHLQTDTFINLQNLSYLGLHLTIGIKFQSDVETSAFAGLIVLQTLDLSGCVRFSFDVLFNVFQNIFNFPNLRTIKLFEFNVDGYGQPLDLNSTFLNVLAERNVTTLEIGYTLVKTLYMNPLHPFCFTIQSFVCKSLTIIHVETFDNLGVCKSLKHIQLSYVNPFSTFRLQQGHRAGSGSTLYEFDLGFVSYTGNNTVSITDAHIPTITIDLTDNKRFNRYAHFFANVEDVILSDSPELFKFPSLRFVLLYNHSLIWRAKTVSVRRNNITFLDVDFRTHLLQNVDTLDIRDNNMQYLGHTFFKTLYSLKRLILADNKLYKMEKSDNFPHLISYLDSLEYLDLSNNGLTLIPMSFFTKNERLRVVLLTKNSLTDFDHPELRSLVFLSLHSNKFAQLDEGSKSCMDKLYWYNRNFTVDLQDNPLQCSCDTLPFLKWSITSLFVQINNTQCSVNGAKKHLNKNTLVSLDSICDNNAILERTILIASIVSISVAGMCIISRIVIRKLHILRLRYTRRTKAVKQLKENTFQYRFVLFLSYSSQNDDLVLNYIYPALSESFTNIACSANAEWQPVCIGDRHFRPGFSIYNEAYRCLEESAVVMAAVSREFCLSVHCRNELEQAMYLDKPIILLFLEEVQKEEMGTAVKSLFLRNVRAKVEMKDTALMFTPNLTDLCLSALDFVK